MTLLPRARCAPSYARLQRCVVLVDSIADIFGVALEAPVRPVALERREDTLDVPVAYIADGLDRSSAAVFHDQVLELRQEHPVGLPAPPIAVGPSRVVENLLQPDLRVAALALGVVLELRYIG